jgi:hypothetical protein
MEGGEEMKSIRKILAGIAIAALAILPGALAMAPTASASASQDAEFYRLLTTDQDHPMVIWDFPGIRSQGIATCQREDAGETPMQALYYLDRRYGGPYTFDDANNISSTADVVYCPWHDANVSDPNWPNESTPVSPQVHPPIMWQPSVSAPPTVTVIVPTPPLHRAE